MKALNLPAGLLMLFFSCTSQPVEDNDKWYLFENLTGKWTRQQGDSLTYIEEWQYGEINMFGIGLTLKNGDTTFREDLGILQIEDKYFYEALVPHNEGVVQFEITEMSENSFTCENANHDFPKKIQYYWNSDSLKVTISDSSRAVHFLYRKDN